MENFRKISIHHRLNDCPGRKNLSIMLYFIICVKLLQLKVRQKIFLVAKISKKKNFPREKFLKINNRPGTIIRQSRVIKNLETLGFMQIYIVKVTYFCGKVHRKSKFILKTVENREYFGRN